MNKKLNKKVPDLRFSEFKEDWNELKFSKLIELISGQHLSPNEYSLDSGEIPYFTGPSDFTNDVVKLTKWTSFSGKFAQKGDILITVKGNGVGEMLFLHLPCVAMGRQLMAIRPIKVVGEIIYQKLYTYRQQLQALASGNVIPGLSRPDILGTKICLPSIDEQEKIASFLGAVDMRLTQLRRKRELLQTYKRGVMQKIFSQGIRFKQDDGSNFSEWEEKRVADIATNISSGRSKVSKDFGDYPIYGSTGIIGKSEIGDYSGEAILIARVGANAGKISFASGVYGVTDNTIIVNAKSSYNIYLLRIQLEIERLNLMVFGSGQPLITGTQIKKLQLVCPESIKEQVKIVNFLTAIDRKIEAISQQIDLTEQFKKGLLQKMFV